MKTSGFIYVLVNPSIPGYVKIGKTTKDPSIRAAELSSATGVPTQFYVAYEAYFNDCDAGESFVHAFLESKGARLSQNREFFSVQPTIAINAILEAKNKDEMEKKQHGENQFDVQNDSSEVYSDGQTGHDEPWESILEEATNCHYGSDDVLEDYQKAIQLYKESIKLGAEESAYIQLANLYAFSMKDFNQGIQWLKRGADKGFSGCWLELAQVFTGRNIHFGDSIINKENAIKCYRKFLSFVDSQVDIQFMWFAFNQYILLVGLNPEQRDIEVVKEFIKKFRQKLFVSENQQGHNEKLRQFDALVSKIRFI